jgi:hypothetical protein
MAAPTFKLLMFAWRRVELSRAEFMDYYEVRHAPLGASLTKQPVDYRRNYPCGAGDGSDGLGGFTVMTEIWHESRRGFEEQLASRRRSPARELLDEDEARFMDRERKFLLVVDEVDARRGVPAELAPDCVKAIRFVPADARREDGNFRARYEESVVPEVERAIHGLIAYRRNYARFDDTLSSQRGASALPEFDLVEEFWIASDTRVQPRELGPNLVRVLERRSPGGQLAAPLAAWGDRA